MEFSETSKVIGPTLSRQLFMLAREYDNVIDLTLGDPDIPTNEGICKVAYEASIAGHTRYSPNLGIPELRDAIAERLSSEYCRTLTKNNVAITVGATEGFFLTLQAILNEGDEVIILEPYWIQYENIVRLNKAIPIVVAPRSDGFEPRIEDISKAVSNKTKAIIVNTPNNPTGIIYSSALLKDISSLFQDKDVYIIADEVYKSLVYADNYVSISKYCKENLIIINSFSKQYSMTGWRVGYVIANQLLIDTISKLQQNIAVCPSTISQFAALEAITNENYYSSLIRDEFRRRRDALVQTLYKYSLANFCFPESTFYAFIDISSSGLDSINFCIELLKRKSVAVIPGIAFGRHCDNYIRLAYTKSIPDIIEGVKRIASFIMEKKA